MEELTRSAKILGFSYFKLVEICLELTVLKDLVGRKTCDSYSGGGALGIDVDLRKLASYGGGGCETFVYIACGGGL